MQRLNCYPDQTERIRNGIESLTNTTPEMGDWLFCGAGNQGWLPE